MCVFSHSGIPQGKLIKRQRLPKNDLGDCWHWKDFNLDIDVTFYGKVFHVCNCNQWTSVSCDICPLHLLVDLLISPSACMNISLFGMQLRLAQQIFYS